MEIRLETIGFVICFLCFLGILTVNLVQANKIDYYLELDKNIIHIETKQGNTYNVELDSLEEFIIKDNL